MIKGFKGKQGKPFEARVILDGDHKTKFEFRCKK
ncbi:topoisomerase C-terminal repeat-containing protein [Dysgonomonas sp.]